MLAQAFGKAAIDAAVVLLVGDGQRQDFLLAEIGKTVSPGLVSQGVNRLTRVRIGNVLNKEPGFANAGRPLPKCFEPTKMAIASSRRRAGAGAIRRVLHFYWRFARGSTLGVRGLVIDENGTVFWSSTPTLNGWHLPGGGVEPGERAARRWRANSLEEGNIELDRAARAVWHLFQPPRLAARPCRAVRGRKFRPARRPDAQPRDRRARLFRARRDCRTIRRPARARASPRCSAARRQRSAGESASYDQTVARSCGAAKSSCGPSGTMPVGFMAVAAVIVPLDMIDAHGLGDARHLVEIAQIVRQVRIVDDARADCI